MTLEVVVPDEPPPIPSPAGCRALLRMVQRAYEIQQSQAADEATQSQETDT